MKIVNAYKQGDRYTELSNNFNVPQSANQLKFTEKCVRYTEKRIPVNEQMS